jgi:hypothetical protein
MRSTDIVLRRVSMISRSLKKCSKRLALSRLEDFMQRSRRLSFALSETRLKSHGI